MNEPLGRQGGNRQRARGARVLCIAAGHFLLVQHEGPTRGETFWLLPHAGREPGETRAVAAAHEMLEQTGVHVRVVRCLRVAAGLGLAGYARFLAELDGPVAADGANPTATVDLAEERFVGGAAWHPIETDRPFGPLSPDDCAFLAPLLRRLTDRC